MGEWCRHRRGAPALVGALAAGAALAQPAGPSFECTPKLTSSVEQRICRDEKLAALDRQLADAYAAAWSRAKAADAESLTLAQRAWVRARNDCWKSQEVAECVEAAYRNRIADLTAQYRLIEPSGAARYLCPGPPPQEASAEFFATEPATAVVTYAGTTQLMRAAPAGSGARYQGGSRQFWAQKDHALVRWGPATREATCPVQEK